MLRRIPIPPSLLPVPFIFLLAVATLAWMRPAAGPPDPPTPADQPAQADPSTAYNWTASLARMRAVEHYVPPPAIPPDAPRLPQEVQADFGRGYALLMVGDYGGADATFAQHVDSDDAEVAAEALFRRGQAAVLDHRHQDAADYLGSLRARYPGTQQAGEGALLLGTALRGLDDCPAAIDAYEAAAQEQPLLASAAHALRAGCYRRLDQPADAIAAEQAALDAKPSRLLRLELLEHRAQEYLQLGDSDAALDLYGTLMDESRTRWYTASLLYTVGLVHRDLGNTERSTLRLLQVVVDYPETAQAGLALDELNAMGASDQVSWYQAGLVRMHQRRLTQAIYAFDQELAENPGGNAVLPALYWRGVSKVRIEATDDGIADLLAVADTWPDSEMAPQALLRAGNAYAYGDRWAEAADLFARLESAYPGTAAGSEARFQHGLTWYARGDYASAAATWDAALDVDAAGEQAARLHLWRGKSRWQLGDGDGARADWQAALGASPEGFAGLRAGELLAGNEAGLAWPAAAVPGPIDDGDIAAWLQAQGEDPDSVEATVAVHPRFQRADALLRVGQRTYARWEIEDLLEEYGSQSGKLYALAKLLQERGFFDMSFKTAQQALAARPGEPLLAAPPALQRLAYPIAYADLLEWQRQERGVDPMLMLALIRQESSFSPLATSGADARGLTQVLPSTGQLLAQQLGRDSFEADDLYRPVVSVEFGALFLQETLARFGNRVYPALAAYNAGPGAAERWLAWHGDDMDVWAERVPYPETYDYVHKVYTYYGRYRLVYGLAG